jgi:hypothetical protein
MRRPPELLSAYQFAQRQHGDKLENPHLLQATLLSVVIKRQSSSPEEVEEAKRECKREFLALLSGVVAA